ncbi:MAG: wax ester/triacylglycerol synthase family O-acyltransferase [Gammaproteobacteria bacterium]|nr:wax ester/triacylglycerol synthase family O-acyltransferase [Gammaproteobacteria bacterium]
MTESQTRFKDEVDALELLMLRGESSIKTRSSMLSIALLDKVPDFTELRETFEYASRQFIRLRQHIVAPAVAITPPRWVVDPDFNLDYHLRRISLAAPGQLRDLLDSAGQILATPMDTQRPLWEAYVIEGLHEAGAKAALVMKMHHAVSDGMGGLMLLRLLFNSSREPSARPAVPTPIPQDMDAITLTRRGLNRAIAATLPALGQTLRQGIVAGKGILRHPGERVEELRQQWQSAKRILGNNSSPVSPLLKRRSQGRRLDVLEYPLADLKLCAKALGSTINDVYIAAIAGGLGRYHEALHCPHTQLPLAMPVDLRSANDGDGGNHFAAARINLPLNEADPKRRIASIQKQVRAAIAEPAINIMSRIAPLLVHLPDTALNEMAELASPVDVQASNVPGLKETAYIAGSKVVKMYPFGPLPGIPLMLVMISHEGVCYIGSHCDTAAIRQPELLRQCLDEEFSALLALTGGASTVAGDRKTNRTKTARANATAKAKTGKSKPTQAAGNSTVPKATAINEPAQTQKSPGAQGNPI